MISNISSNTTTNAGSTAMVNAITAQVPAKQAGDIAPTATSSTVTISSLARQLAESAAQNSTLNRSELANKAQLFYKECSAEANPAIQAKHDSEVPKSKDPELLARAKQATAFMVACRHGGGEKNPFAGLSREQLANITYDDSGTYTFNERIAAYAETSRIEYEWAVKVGAKAMDEYNSTGKMTGFFTSVLEHYKGLPAIEQAQYPASYEADLTNKIKLDFNYRTNTAGGNSHKTLIDSLLYANSPRNPNSLQPNLKPAAA